MSCMFFVYIFIFCKILRFFILLNCWNKSFKMDLIFWLMVSCVSEGEIVLFWIKVMSTLPVSLLEQLLAVMFFFDRPVFVLAEVVIWDVSAVVSFVYLCPPAAEKETHRQRHCGHRVPGGKYALCTRHDPVQLPACICGGAGGKCMYRQCHLQGWF